MSAIEAAADGARTHEKKHKKHKEKSSKSEKKRAREDDEGAAEERRHKKSKSRQLDAAEPLDATIQQDAQTVRGDEQVKTKKHKKDKKHRKAESEDAAVDAEPMAPVDEVTERKKKKHKKSQESANEEATIANDETREVEDGKTAKKKHKKKKHHDDEVVEAEDAELERKEKKKKKSKKHIGEEDAETKVQHNGDIQEAQPAKTSRVYAPPDIPSDPQFPFFTQTVSLYEPLYPNGWAQPVSACESQYLHQLRNRYVPTLRGVLLDYKNVSFGASPGRTDAATEDDETSCVASRNEFGAGFGWITADMELFVPSRGAWMEGSVNLQTEGHIGVVCFGRFNASIEARRLPSDWSWVPNESPDAAGFEETASLITADEHGVTRQLHSTGFWTDADGDKIKGRIRFRIRNFDVGTTGKTSYLSLEGTMLDRKAEKLLVQEEAKEAQLRQERRTGRPRAHERKRAPDFSMTRFAEDAEQPNEVQDVPDASEAKTEYSIPSRMTSEE